jgi:hypothetical protein
MDSRNETHYFGGIMPNSINREQVTEILVRHMQAAMAVHADNTTSVGDKETALYAIISNIANDIDKAME